VQGVGSVGGHLAQLLEEAGASVLVSDVDADRAAAVGSHVVAPDGAIGTECDVYAPCALGGTLTVDTVPRLRCRVVAGSANNQLAEPEAADLLRDAGILYAPDYVINAGGAIAIYYLELTNRRQADVDAALLGIGETLTDIYERAARHGTTTAAAADALAAARLS
jgi:leucine dehydrogenase